MSDDVHVSVEDFFPEILELAENGDDKLLPHMDQALNTLAEAILVQWRKFTMGERMPGTPRVINSRGDYTKSISIAESTDKDTRVVQSDGPWTGWIEKGHGEIDLKPGLLHGPKARMGKNGPYTIVSFRAGVPTSLRSNQPMDQVTYAHMLKTTNRMDKEFAAGESDRPGTSRVLKGNHPNSWKTVDGGFRKRNQYEWGYRLPASRGGEAQVKQVQGGKFNFNGTSYHIAKGSYKWSTGKNTNMVRMDTTAGNKKTSEYRTFRVVSMRSDPRSWVVPAQEPLPIREKVIEAVVPKAREILTAMLEEDLK